MKENDTLKEKVLNPKKQTIDFLIQYSRSIKMVKGKRKSFLISKN